MRGVVGSLIEMLAAVPSVIIGLWGILVLGPFVQKDLEPFLGSFLGWTPFFSGEHHTGGYLPAMIVLTIMIVPISSSVCRELFLTVPQELKEGAYGLGLTRWEMVRGVSCRTRAAASSARSCSASAARSARRSPSRR